MEIRHLLLFETHPGGPGIPGGAFTTLIWPGFPGGPETKGY